MNEVGEREHVTVEEVFPFLFWVFFKDYGCLYLMLPCILGFGCVDNLLFCALVDGLLFVLENR